MPPNFADKTIWTGDNLDILWRMSSLALDPQLIAVKASANCSKGVRDPDEWRSPDEGYCTSTPTIGGTSTQAWG